MAAARGALKAARSRVVARAGDLRRTRIGRLSRSFPGWAFRSSVIGNRRKPCLSCRHLTWTTGMVTAGGRVLGVTARAVISGQAIANAYAAVGQIHFDGMHYRKDIGQKGPADATIDD